MIFLELIVMLAGIIIICWVFVRVFFSAFHYAIQNFDPLPKWFKTVVTWVSYVNPPERFGPHFARTLWSSFGKISFGVFLYTGQLWHFFKTVILGW